VSGDLPLFVYGTLRTGGPRAALLGDSPRRPATTRGALYDLPAGYPALTGGDDLVYGEIVGPLDDRRLALVDRYEGVDEGLYRREVWDVAVDATQVRAWVYVMDDPLAHGGVRVPSGRWTPRRRR
jgi:gamma-glutamylcyclotransferase (GGCT)/AIG2-like uncharacterized protein YtfP